VVLWLLALGGEAAEIFWVLKQDPINMTLLIGGIVLIGVLAIIGDVLWKRANRADPAPRSEPVRFFTQNQLGAIISVIAFLPLILMIFLNKTMNSKQKGAAGTIAVVIALIAVYAGISFNSPSVEKNQNLTCAQLPADTPATEIDQCNTDVARVTQLMGKDEVTWTKSGSVYHLCVGASEVNKTSQDNQIYTGTVADAIADGKTRLTLQVDQELAECSAAAGATPTP
jgi:phosphotransferase system  glucose/maltose/N-acetylglucosamine-specific IIC component